MTTCSLDGMEAVGIIISWRFCAPKKRTKYSLKREFSKEILFKMGVIAMDNDVWPSEFKYVYFIT